MKNIDKKANDYAVKEVKDTFPTTPEKTKELLKLLLKKAYIQGCKDSGEDVTIEEIEVLGKLCTFN